MGASGLAGDRENSGLKGFTAHQVADLERLRLLYTARCAAPPVPPFDARRTLADARRARYALLIARTGLATVLGSAGVAAIYGAWWWPISGVLAIAAWFWTNGLAHQLAALEAEARSYLAPPEGP